MHDLRTPLAVVSGFAELLEHKGDSLTPEQRADYVKRIAEGSRALSEILDNARPEQA
ncbi:MAG TPA: histidine kinase dimerization/phospho-acceptor domain-containing protein [Solirubrobacteraceae bacterium]